MSSRLIGLVAFVVTAAIAWGFWSWANAPVELPDVPNAHVACTSYAPFRGRQTPHNESFIAPPEQIAEDMAILKSVTDCVRLYSARQGLEEVSVQAAQLGMSVLQGIWIGANPQNNQMEIDAALDVVARNPQAIKAVIVGNEVLLRREQSPENLRKLIREVKARTDKPVTYADVWEFWMKNRDLADEVDFVTVHILPYWEDEPVSIDEAMAHLRRIIDEVKAAFPNKPIMIGETGWPSEGRTRGPAVPSLVNQASFIRDFIPLARNLGVDYNLIEAFDQPWKRVQEGTVGGHWGLVDEYREQKFPLTGPVVEMPHWHWLAAGGILVAALLMIAAGRRIPDHEIDEHLGREIAGWVSAVAGAQLAGATLLLSIDHLSLVNRGPVEWTVGIGLWLVSGMTAVVLARRWAGPPEARIQPVPVADVLQALRQPLTVDWLGTGDAARALRLGLLKGLAAVAVAIAMVGLALDPRYRDFPIVTFLIPAIGWAVDALMPVAGRARTPRLRLKIEEALLALMIGGGALAVAIGEGPENGEAHLWAVIGLIFAAAVAVAPRRSQTEGV